MLAFFDKLAKQLNNQHSDRKQIIALSKTLQLQTDHSLAETIFALLLARGATKRISYQSEKKKKRISGTHQVFDVYSKEVTELSCSRTGNVIEISSLRN